MLVLASQSPRRSEILRAAGFDFTVRPAVVDETALPGERPEDYVARLAEMKARAVEAHGVGAGRARIEPLRVVGGGQIHPSGARLDYAGAERVSQIRPDGNFDRVGVALEEVLVASAGQGVGQRKQGGSPQVKVAGGGVPLGDGDADRPVTAEAADLVFERDETVLHGLEVRATVVVGAEVIELAARGTQRFGGGKGGKQPD